MSKVFKKVREDTVGFLIGTNVEFVSLVKYPANRMPFKIIKGGEIMEGMLYKVLVPKDIKDDELKELAQKYEFSIEKEVEDETGTHRVFTQVDENIVIKSEDLDMKPIDEDNKIFGLYKKVDVREKTENDEEIEKSEEVSISDVIDTIYATLDLIYGALYHKGMSEKDRTKLINDALSSLSKLSGVTISKLEVVNKEDKYKDFIVEKFSKLESDIRRIEEIENSIPTVDVIMGKVDELIKKELESIMGVFKEEVGVLTTKDTFDKVIKEINTKLEELSGNIVRKSELNEVIKTSGQGVSISSGRFITAA